MNPHRKKKISSLANFLANDFLDGYIVNLTDVAAFEELPLHYDHYEDTFDGMLVYVNSTFHIHINIDKGNTPTSKRGRFTLAHELGHYLIDEHRIALKYGMITSHQSKNGVLNKDLIELEADYFASVLLMPEKQFKEICARKNFSFQLLDEISSTFQISIMAAILRFIDVGSREFMVVMSKNKMVRWYAKSKDFQKVSFKFKVNSHIPSDSMSWSFINVDRDWLSNIDEVDTEVWFSRGFYGSTVYEQYYYSVINGYLITLLWFK